MNKRQKLDKSNTVFETMTLDQKRHELRNRLEIIRQKCPWFDYISSDLCTSESFFKKGLSIKTPQEFAKAQPKEVENAYGNRHECYEDYLSSFLNTRDWSPRASGPAPFCNEYDNIVKTHGSDKARQALHEHYRCGNRFLNEWLLYLQQHCVASKASNLKYGFPRRYDIKESADSKRLPWVLCFRGSWMSAHQSHLGVSSLEWTDNSEHQYENYINTSQDVNHVPIFLSDDPSKFIPQQGYFSQGKNYLYAARAWGISFEIYNHQLPGPNELEEFDKKVESLASMTRSTFCNAPSIQDDIVKQIKQVKQLVAKATTSACAVPDSTYPDC